MQNADKKDPYPVDMNVEAPRAFLVKNAGLGYEILHIDAICTHFLRSQLVKNTIFWISSCCFSGVHAIGQLLISVTSAKR